MIYAYDIFSMLSNQLVDFYDWDDKDKFIHFRKIPVFKISKDDYKKLILNDVSLPEDFLKKIKEKADPSNKRNVNTKTSCIFSCESDAFIALIEENKIIKKSKLLINELLEVLELADNIEETKLEYKIESIKQFNRYTRNNKKNIESILKYINELYDKEKIDYLYYEIFNKDDAEDKKEKIKEYIENNYYSSLEIINTIKILSHNV